MFHRTLINCGNLLEFKYLYLLSRLPTGSSQVEEDPRRHQSHHGAPGARAEPDCQEVNHSDRRPRLPEGRELGAREPAQVHCQQMLPFVRLHDTGSHGWKRCWCFLDSSREDELREMFQLTVLSRSNAFLRVAFCERWSGETDAIMTAAQTPS